MNKYEVFLADNYRSSKPFMTDWDYELIGDKLRAEFDEYFAREEQRAGAGVGKSKQLLKGEYVKKFMISKRINLIDDPGNGNLKSVFILRVGEKKVVDGRAKDSLAPRFEYKTRENEDGMTVLIDGFMKFNLVEGEEKKGIDAEEDVQVSGNDVQYFNEESEGEPKVESEKEVQEKKEEVFACEVCGKEFDSKRAVNAHSLSHRKK